MKKLVVLTLLVIMLLTACSAAPAAAPTVAATVAPTAAADQPTPAADQPTTAVEAVATATPGPASCTVVGRQPTPGPTETSLFPLPTAEDWSEGVSGARLTIIEYSDFQCPYCSKIAPELRKLIAAHPEEVQVIFRHYPLVSIHDKSLLAAQASEAAGKQGKFWQMHDALFTNQAAWETIDGTAFETWLMDQAKTIGLDVDTFKTDLKSDAIVKKVADAQAHGEKIGIPGTPFLVVNGRPYQGPNDSATLESILKVIKLEDNQYTECPSMTIDPAKQYTATLKTDAGDIVIQLFADKAPTTVNSFVFLAQKGWFDNIIFHRVIPEFVAQTGDPSGSGYGGPGYAFGSEIASDLKYDKAGLVGMANAGPNSNGSQFFITYAPLPTLDGKYTIFGQVIEGMDVAKKLQARDPSAGGDLPAGTKLLTVTIQEK